MSRIDDLIAEHCPAGVPFKTLGDVGELIRGRRFTKADYVDVGLGCIHYGEVYTDYGTWATKVRSYVQPELRSTLRLARTGDLVIAATGESIEDVCKAVAWLGEDDIAVHDDCYVFRHDLDAKYVSYFFKSSAFHAQKIRFVSDSKLARMAGANLAKIRMPVPPPSVQREIASILDRMESLKADVKADLEAVGHRPIAATAMSAPPTRANATVPISLSAIRTATEATTSSAMPAPMRAPRAGGDRWLGCHACSSRGVAARPPLSFDMPRTLLGRLRCATTSGRPGGCERRGRVT